LRFMRGVNRRRDPTCGNGLAVGLADERLTIEHLRFNYNERRPDTSLDGQTLAEVVVPIQ